MISAIIILVLLGLMDLMLFLACFELEKEREIEEPREWEKPPKMVPTINTNCISVSGYLLKDAMYGEWIPCSERLPNENGTYLTTYEWVGKTGTKYIEIEGIDFEHGRWNCHDYEKVTAWMPLPEPWEGGNE